jgi:hypothetical protein
MRIFECAKFHLLASLSTESFPAVHGQGACAKAKANSFWPVFSAMALFAIEFSFMWACICGIQQFIAHP